MIVLDTNVLSELMRPAPQERVLAWLDQQATEGLFLTAITVAEVLYGIARLPDGQRKTGLRDAAVAMFAEDFDGRVLAFDAAAAVHYADIVSMRDGAGRPIQMADAQIAAICRCHGAILATRNTKDFEELKGLALSNPWLGDC